MPTIQAIFLLMSYYVIVLAAIPIAVKAFTRVPREIIRKFQHIGYAMSVFILLEYFETWTHALLALAVLVILAYPFLWGFERTKWFKKVLVQRRETGELRKQLLFVQMSYAFLILVFWGLMGEAGKPIMATGVMAWGYGDAMAALLGKAFGKRYIDDPHIRPRKTYVGTVSMALAAAITVLFMARFYMEVSWLIALVIVVFASPVAALTELYAQDGADTLVVPASVAVTIYIVLEGLQWLIM